MNRLLWSGYLVLFCAFAVAADPAGKWVGRLVKGPDVQSNTNPTLQRTQLNSYKQDFGTVKYTLELKVDRTFTRALRRGKMSSVSTGTWSVNGLAVTLVTNTISGAKINPQSSMFVLGSDGKTLTYRQPNGVTLQYKRA